MENASLNAGGGTKRRRAKGGLASVAEACSSPFKRSKSATVEQSGSRLLGEPMLPEAGAPVVDEMDAAETAAPTAAEGALRDQMVRQTSRHLVEMRGLREERDFYLRKLEAVEAACSTLGEGRGTILAILAALLESNPPPTCLRSVTITRVPDIIHGL